MLNFSFALSSRALRSRLTSASFPSLYIVTGDSTRNNSFNRCIDYYTHQLAKLGTTVVNNSASGQSGQDWAASTDQTTLAQAIAATPGDGAGVLLEYSLGINDDKNGATPVEVKAWLKDGVEAYRTAKPRARVVLVVPVYTANTTRNANLETIYTEISSELGLQLINPLSVLGAVHGDPDYYQDGTHPTVYGSMRLVNFILNELVPNRLAASVTLDENFTGGTPPTAEELAGAIESGYWNSSGTASSNSGWRRLPAIAVEPNFVLQIQHQGNRIEARFLNEAGTLVATINTAEVEGEAYRTVTVPVDAVTALINLSSVSSTYDTLNDTPSVKYQLADTDTLTQAELNSGVTLKFPYPVILATVPELVDSVTTSGNSGASGLSCAIPSGATVGNWQVLIATSDVTTAFNLPSGWTEVSPGDTAPGNVVRVQVFKREVTAENSGETTVVLSGASYKIYTGTVQEWSGTAGIGSYVQDLYQTSPSSTNHSGHTMTTSGTNSVLVEVLAFRNSGTGTVLDGTIGSGVQSATNLLTLWGAKLQPEAGTSTAMTYTTTSTLSGFAGVLFEVLEGVGSGGSEEEEEPYVPPVYTGLPIGYGTGSQTTGPGEWAFVADITASGYQLQTANKTATPETFTTVLAGLADGDVVTLAPGNYSPFGLTGKTFTARLQSETLHGAKFLGTISIEDCGDIQIAGIECSGLTFRNSTHSTAYYCLVNGSMSKVTDSGNSTELNWFSCIADLGWPDPPSKSTAGFIERVHGTFTGTVTEGPQASTVKNCIFMKATEDNFKGTWMRGVGFVDCLFWGCQVSDEDAATGDFHPDSAQFSSQGADSTTQCQDLWFVRCAFVNTSLSGIREGQGFWAKDGLFLRITAEGCIFTSGLNSTSAGLHDAHTDSLLKRCSATQHIRVSGSSNTVEACIYGVNNTSDGTTVPTYTNNVTFGYDLPETTVYQFGRPSYGWELRSFLPQSETVWQNQGASELLLRCHNRMVAEGVPGFVPSGWSLD